MDYTNIDNSELKYVENSECKYLEPAKKESFDLYLCFCGIERCAPCHSFGPAVRSQYLIHYIISGKGTYTVGDKTYHLKENDGFLIWPGELTYYKADKDNPWQYVWIAFDGVKAKTYLSYANLDEKNLIFNYSKDTSLVEYVLKMFDLKHFTISNKLQLEGLLYMFMSKLTENVDINPNQSVYNSSEIYLEKSIEFIKNNYVNPIKINEIADYIGINRSYLTNIFKKNLNISPQDFLLNYRIDKATELLTLTNFSIKVIANSVGYHDPLTFSKIFKKIKGISPKKYREDNVLKANKADWFYLYQSALITN